MNYVAGERFQAGTSILSEAAQPAPKGLRLVVRLVGPDLKARQVWNDIAPIDLAEGAESAVGPPVDFVVADDFARAFFFVVLDLSGSDGKPLARNIYTFRCPPQLEDQAFREAYRSKPQQGLLLTEGPWLRPQVEKTPPTLAARLLSAARETDTRSRLAVEVCNNGEHPAVMTHIHVAGSFPYVADDAYFWLEPGETRTVNLRIRTAAGTKPSELAVSARAWNVLEPPVIKASLAAK